MNIEKFATDELTAEISIEITPADYLEKFNKGLKDYASKARMPGFRVGKVPVGMVKKMVGKSLLADELNNLTSDAIFNYINDNKIEIIGNPLPIVEQEPLLDLDESKTYTFKFEIAYSPSFNLDIDKNKTFELHRFIPDAKFIDEQIAEYQKRLGEKIEREISSKGDTLTGVLRELDEQGEPKENGLEALASTITFDDIKDEQYQALFIDKKVGDVVVFEPKKAIANETVLAALLRIDKNLISNFSDEFSFTIERIETVQPAEVNQAFFDKLFGENIIDSEEALRERIKNDTIAHYEKDAQNRFFNEVVENLINTLSFNLPEDFLKRWLISANREHVDVNDINENFDKYERGLRWQLIEGRIIDEFKLNVSEEDVVNHFYQEYMNYFGPNFQNEEYGARILEMAKGMLKNKEEVKRVTDRIYIDRITKVFLDGFNVKVVESDFDTWVEHLKKPLSA